MIKILKYPLIDIRAELQLPKGSHILTVGGQRRQHQHADSIDRVMLWAMVDMEETELETRVFISYSTGESISDDGNHTFIGTYFLNDGAFVGHLFEIGRSRPDRY